MQGLFIILHIFFIFLHIPDSIKWDVFKLIVRRQISI